MKQDVFSEVKELREVTDIKEVAEMLHSGNWIALSATGNEPYVFCLGKVNPSERPMGGQERR